ncbi:TlpA family protein disulfide reductase [Streptomyces sp. APSN-46.1]|uniref:TlpA family protein disulfide reductase n=1 Tax=Streptomyces sp. APSN-46.1 TaxID=2929049 RepID=UPI001FB20421|nr:TlpA disulfide reductase family protein [Streptomyces sp. APSN-46.1]MCJ1676321.1 TlpA family protein disulfide reductase [Streptomyces sp. APSN-46.1]
MRRPVPRPTALAGAGLAVAVAGCLYAAAGAASDGDGGGGRGAPPGPASAAVRAGSAAVVVDSGARSAAPALAGADLDGKPVSLAEFRGQVVVLNVWGSWCGPCRAEADDLERLSGQTRAQGVRFLGINTRDRDRAAARSFVRAHGVGFPSLHDPTGELLLRFPPALLNPQTIPSTLVIDRHGRIAVSIGGAVTDEELRPLLARVAEETS